MSSYISSNANRFYTALESAYGAVGTITATNRIPAVKLGIQQQVDMGTRRDKTGSRTFAGVPAGVRRRTNFDLQTYLTSWDKTAAGPGYGPLFEAALGGSPVRFGGGSATSSTAAGQLGFGAPHGLAAPRLLRRRVSGAKSAENDAGRRSTAVRHTPFTAMLAPSVMSASTFWQWIFRRAPAGRLSMDSTAPSSSTIPVNIQPSLTM